MKKQPAAAECRLPSRHVVAALFCVQDRLVRRFSQLQIPSIFQDLVPREVCLAFAIAPTEVR